MRSPSVLVFRPRRVLALAGLVSLAGGLLMLPGLAHPGRAAAAAGAASVRAAAATGCTGRGTTVTGLHLWDPSTNHPLANASCVTVDQTSNLVNQMVQVNWANFTPSANTPYGPSSTLYPVMIAECKGAKPASSADCYGATNGGVTGGSGPFGPMNTAYATTAPDGTGQADVLINTVAENQFLGCDQKHACSLVVVPAQGGNVIASPPVCTDHSQDGTFAIGQLAFSANFNTCSWADRLVIPLTFAPTPNACKFKNAAFTAAGSPMLARAMNSWVSGLCLGRHGLTIQYNSQIPEPLAVAEANGGLTNMALTTRPASAEGIATSTRHFIYAPVAVSAVSIAYWIDNPTTGLPVTGVKLDQRLLLKLLTQSYDFQNEGVPCTAPPPPAGIGCDNGVDRNPLTLFDDPEFQKLNPGVQPVQGLGAAFQVPTVQSGHSDMTWFVTRWIAANADASHFLDGQFDPWGMHINTAYEGPTNLTYPTDAFTAQDSYPVIQHRYSPVFPLSLAASYQAENWEPGTSYIKDQFGNFPKDPIQPPGQRALFGVLDEGDSAAFRFPVAAIPNATGKYALPTKSAMAAALKGMQSDGSGTQQVNLASTDKAAYPLTMVIYAMAPTSGTPHKTAAAMAHFLDFAAGAGQKEGVQPGQLPPGYLPLPANLAAKTRKDAIAVLNQTGATTTPKTKTTHNSGGGGSGTSSASSSAKSPGTGSASQPSTGATNGAPPIGFVPVAHVSPASITRYALPALLILGGLAALAGSSTLVGSDPAEAAARLRRMRHGSYAFGRKTWGLVTRRRPG
jgi:hypothetical protein